MYHLINRESGAVERTAPAAGPLTFDSDGNLLIADQARVRRFTPDLKPLPLPKDSPYAGTGPGEGTLDLTPAAKGPVAPDRTPRIGSIIPGGEGDFYVMPQDDEGDMRRPRPALHFDRAGRLIESRLQLELGQDRPGNVFVGDEPARLLVHVTNLEERPVELAARWTVTDFDGKAAEAQQRFSVPARSRHVEPLCLTLLDYGWFAIAGTVVRDGRPLLSLDTRAARLRSRSLKTDPDSPFAIVWGTHYALSGLAGAKKERCSPMTGTFFVAPHLRRADLPEATDMRRGAILGAYAESRRWGIRSPMLISYGEPWLTSHWMAPVYDYDLWLNECLAPSLRQVAAPDLQHVQFWNEPDNFGYHQTINGPFAREHYAVLLKQVWCLSKTIAKDTRVIGDGDAGALGMIEQTLPQFDAVAYTDGVPFHYPGAANMTWTSMSLPGGPEGKAVTVERLKQLRDQYYPGRPLLNTEDGWWGHVGIKPEVAAASIPRVYIPQLAVGVDELYWYAQVSAEGDPSYLLGVDNLPWPSYCAYASMTRNLEGATYLGPIDLKTPGTFAYLFGRGDEMIVPLWAAAGTPQVDLPCGAETGVVADMMDRERPCQAEAGAIRLKLGIQPQYVRFRRTAWSEAILRAEAARRRKELKVDDVADLPAAIAGAAKKAATGRPSMTRLFYLVEAARHAALAGELRNLPPRIAPADPAAARKAIETAEGTDGYLRESRIALGWAERLERATPRQAADRVADWQRLVTLAAKAVIAMARQETPMPLGVVVNAYVGAPGELEKLRATVPVRDKPETRIDANVRFQLEAKAGSLVELEITVRNFADHPLQGTVAPRLPGNWTVEAGPAEHACTVESGKFDRIRLSVRIPPGTRPGVYPVSARLRKDGRTIAAIHQPRVEVKP
ncbi:MAG: NEW3 domain-containing protein [Thermoguttaceae bacterium]